MASDILAQLRVTNLARERAPLNIYGITLPNKFERNRGGKVGNWSPERGDYARGIYATEDGTPTSAYMSRFVDEPGFIQGVLTRKSPPLLCSL